MTRVPASEVRTRFAAILDQVAHEGDRVAIMRNGKPVVVVISVEDAELLEALEDRIDVAAARAARAEAKKKGTTSWDDVLRRAGMK